MQSDGATGPQPDHLAAVASFAGTGSPSAGAVLSMYAYGRSGSVGARYLGDGGVSAARGLLDADRGVETL